VRWTNGDFTGFKGIEGKKKGVAGSKERGKADEEFMKKRGKRRNPKRDAPKQRGLKAKKNKGCYGKKDTYSKWPKKALRVVGKKRGKKSEC